MVGRETEESTEQNERASEREGLLSGSGVPSCTSHCQLHNETTSGAEATTSLHTDSADEVMCDGRIVLPPEIKKKELVSFGLNSERPSCSKEEEDKQRRGVLAYFQDKDGDLLRQEASSPPDTPGSPGKHGGTAPTSKIHFPLCLPLSFPERRRRSF